MTSEKKTQTSVSVHQQQPMDIEAASIQDDDGFNPPDGGFTAWSQVVSSHLISAMTWGYAGSFGVFQLHYEQTLHLPSSQISWIGSVQVFLTFGLCAISGRLSDAGYSRPVLITGCVLIVLGTFMTSLARTYWQIFLAQGICTGIGLGIAFMPAVSVCSSYFKKNRSFALTLGTIGTSIGGTVFPATIQYATPHIGFPWAVRCAAFIAMVFSITACVLFKPYLPARKGALVEWAAFKEMPYLFFSLGAFLNFYAMYFGSFYINSYARNVIGFSTVESVNLLLLTNALGIPTRPIIGYVANNYFGPINVYIAATTAVSVLLFGWIGVTTRAGLYVFSVVYGIALASNQGVFPASLASLTKDPQKMGIRFGMVETLCSFATLAGTPTAGAILDRMHGKYLVSQIWAGAVMAAAAFIYAICRVKATGWRFKVKI